MADQPEVFPLDELYRVGVVVKDLESTARNYAEVFGIDRWKVSTFDANRLTDTTVDGRPVEFSFRSAIGTTPSGQLSFELIEPLDGMSSYKHFRITRGLGVHNLVLKVATEAEKQGLDAFFSRLGVKSAQSGVIDGSLGFTEYDTRALLGGYLVRVMWSDSGVSEAPADEEWDLSSSYTRPAGVVALDVPNVSHFGVVVRDLMTAVRHYAEFFGIPKWSFTNWRSEPGRLVEPYYIGAAGTYRPVNHEYFTTNVRMKNFGFEIIQPTFGPQHYKEDFLNIVGEGIHHMSLLLYTNDDDWKRQANWLDSIGVPVCMGGDLWAGEVHFAYVDGLAKLGFVIESVVRRTQPDFARMRRENLAIEFDDVPVGALT